MHIAAAGAGAGRHRVWRGGAGPGRLQASWAAAAGGRLWAGAFAPAWAGPVRPGLAAFGRPEPPPAAVPVLQRPLEDGHAAPPYPVPASPSLRELGSRRLGGQNLSWTSTLLYDNILICLVKANNLIASVWCPSQWKGEKGRRLKAAAAPATVRAGAIYPIQLGYLYAPFSAAALKCAVTGRKSKPGRRSRKKPKPGDLPADALCLLQSAMGYKALSRREKGCKFAYIMRLIKFTHFGLPPEYITNAGFYIKIYALLLVCFFLPSNAVSTRQ